LPHLKAEWLTQSKQRAIKILDKISPQSRPFARAVQTVLSQEKNWVAWKQDSCKSYEKEAFVDDESDGRQKKKRRLQGSQASIPDFLGNDEMTLLWEKGSKMIESLKEQKYRNR
jgi:THO complex subunit 1 transcription elongation factor